jgi:hypothetical protein
MKITQKQARANEQAVWAVYPEATFWGVDAKRGRPNAHCLVYQSEEVEKVIGEGDTYEEAWADAVSRLPKKK